MSWIEAIRKPHAFSARTEDSRPGPGPLIRTSRFLTPHSSAARPAASAATWAANGVDLRDPLTPAPPLLAHDGALPFRSVIVMIVLLNEAWMCAIPSATFFLTFLRTRWPLACAWFGFRLATLRLPSSVPRPLCVVPYACARWCEFAGRAPAGPCGAAGRDSTPG